MAERMRVTSLMALEHNRSHGGCQIRHTVRSIRGDGQVHTVEHRRGRLTKFSCMAGGVRPAADLEHPLGLWGPWAQRIRLALGRRLGYKHTPFWPTRRTSTVQREFYPMELTMRK